MNDAKTAGCAVRKENVSEQITSRLDRIVGRMVNLNDRVHCKLDPLMMPERPVDCSPSMEPETFPVYFDRIRSMCYQIESKIDSIESALDRTEI